MKRLKLRALELGASEILSREQLKSVSGGASTSQHLCYCYTLETGGMQWIGLGDDCVALNAEAMRACQEADYEGGECGGCS